MSVNEIKPVAIGDILVGPGQPVYMIGEIGINHNGDVEIAKQLMDVAAKAGAQAVKFQKRNPDVAVPEDQKSKRRDTPWGEMTYLEYKFRVEFEDEEYTEIDRYARELGIQWFASPWDIDSVNFLDRFDAVTFKIASASVTDIPLLEAVKATGKPVILSTGMSTLEQIDKAVETLGTENLVMMHATSTYPLPPEEVNLLAIPALRERYNVPVGYSGHEIGTAISVAAVALGAVTVERHITLDTSMWGSDQKASMEPEEFTALVADIRTVETALGDGKKRVMPGEESKIESLRVVK
ncbi:N-acetylneuraminate synthase family protein [Brevibacterium sp. R8603A2]|uniref:N-acetylneuraminate synthase family protein n=1 Tax=Brevibacterium sp. R8603A2 TaxID=2929779 RepID=UPI001FFAD637|nr:N-acetylneuraminate synthase family protein [Brevibacterium sp. R8603A2]MCK1801602.1 N-acetylneuraminate synthase family protein [Brevibacterium sp. R8603A2]